MTLRLFTTPLLATTLLLGTLGCSKKEEATPSPLVGTGSYQYDGTSANCQVSASTATGTITSSTTGGVQPGQQTDYLAFTLQPAPQLPTGETVRVVFAKATGQPNSAYTLSSIIYFPDQTTVTGKLHNSIQRCHAY